MKNKHRNIGLDILKVIAAFLVVCIHAPFEDEFGKDLKAVARCAVPIFFIITGFFYSKKIDSSKTNKSILKLLKFCVISNIFYIIFQMILCSIDGKEQIILFKNIFNKESIKNLLIYNESPVYFHLWYLNALLYVLIIMKFVSKYNMMKYMYIVTPVLLILDLVYGKYSLLILHREIPYIQIRNFLFVGIPYFCIGNYINEKIYSKIKEKSNKKYIFFTIIFIITTIFERCILISFNFNATREHYISSTFLGISLFIYFLLYNGDNKYLNYIAKVGKDYSTLIYIMHPAIIEILDRLMDKFTLYNKFYPIIIFIVTYIICILYKTIYMKLKKITSI